jgi:hypothetical protein
MAPVIPRHKRPPATTRRQKQGFLGSNAILACVMWPSTPAEWRSLAMAAPRIWPSTAVTVSASAISRITWLIPTPHRLTVYASAAPLPDAPATLVIGRLARPYPSGTFPHRIALTSPSARRLRRNPQKRPSLQLKSRSLWSSQPGPPHSGLLDQVAAPKASPPMIVPFPQMRCLSSLDRKSFRVQFVRRWFLRD